jgi:hypothetical protein
MAEKKQAAERPLPPVLPFATPTIGRIVHFRRAAHDGKANGALVSPAIVTRVHGGELCNLTELPDLGAPRVHGSVPFGDAETPFSWFWPPRV